MSIEGIPDGWELVRIGKPFINERYISLSGNVTNCVCIPSGEAYAIVRKIRKIDKPKQYRPFASAAEFEPFRDRWFRPKCSPDQCILTTAYNDRGHWTAKEQDTWEAMFDLYTFDDGTPFGIEVTE